MKPFHFKQFSLNQNSKVFRVGTDAVLLGALASVEDKKNILEVGAGSGIVSLMLAQRNLESRITAIDISKEATELAAQNFELSPFQKRLQTLHSDFKKFVNNSKFDLVVSNPPYFELNESQKDVVARQKVELSFEELIKNSAKNMAEMGMFSAIIPSAFSENFIEIATAENLFLQRKVSISGIINMPAKRAVLEFGFKEKITEESTLTIEKSPRKFTDEYLKLTEDFHVFKI